VELVVTDAFFVIREVRGDAADGAAVFLPVAGRAAAGAADFVVELFAARAVDLEVEVAVDVAG